MNPEDNLRLARVLAAAPHAAPVEASRRAACGRAYYAAFAIARDLLRASGFVVPSDSSAHGIIVYLLKSSSDSAVRGAARDLAQLRATRNEADYDIGSATSSVFGARRAWRSVSAAEDVLRRLRQVHAVDPRLRIP